MISQLLGEAIISQNLIKRISMGKWILKENPGRVIQFICDGYLKESPAKTVATLQEVETYLNDNIDSIEKYMVSHIRVLLAKSRGEKVDFWFELPNKDFVSGLEEIGMSDYLSSRDLHDLFKKMESISHKNHELIASHNFVRPLCYGTAVSIIIILGLIMHHFAS